MTKRIFIFSIICLIAQFAMAQVPQAINYQAVARNNNGQALANQTINIRLSILNGGSPLYTETRNVTTNALGLFNVKIGSPGTTSTTGSFTSIDWANNVPEIKKIKVELDLNNTNTFTDMGSQSLASVPYAFASDNSIRIGGFDVSTSEPSNGDVLQWDGSAWQPSDPMIGGQPVSNLDPNTGDLLVYNGTTWVPKPGPKIISHGGLIQQINFGNGAPFIFAGPTSTINVLAGQYVSAYATGVLGHASNNPQPFSYAVCWSEVAAGSPLETFLGTIYPDATLPVTPNRLPVTAVGSRLFTNGGNYKVGLCVKNKSGSVNFGSNDYTVHTIIIH